MAEVEKKEGEQGKEQLTPEQELVYWKQKAERLTNEFNSEKQKRQELEASFKKDKVEMPADSSGFAKLGKEDVIALLMNTQEKYEQANTKLSEITKGQERAQKLGVVKQIFKDNGGQDNCVDVLEKFIDFDKIDPNDQTDIKLKIRATKERYGFLFGGNGSYSKSAPAPGRLETSDTLNIDGLKKEYNSLLGNTKLTQAERLQKMTENLQLQEEVKSKSKRQF